MIHAVMAVLVGCGGWISFLCIKTIGAGFAHR